MFIVKRRNELSKGSDIFNAAKLQFYSIIWWFQQIVISCD